MAIACFTINLHPSGCCRTWNSRVCLHEHEGRRRSSNQDATWHGWEHVWLHIWWVDALVMVLCNGDSGSKIWCPTYSIHDIPHPDLALGSLWIQNYPSVIWPICFGSVNYSYQLADSKYHSAHMKLQFLQDELLKSKICISYSGI